jgi:hypothetical protein
MNFVLHLIHQILVESRRQLVVVKPVVVEHPSLQIHASLVHLVSSGRLDECVAHRVVVTVNVPALLAHPAKLKFAVAAEHATRGQIVWRNQMSATSSSSSFIWEIIAALLASSGLLDVVVASWAFPRVCLDLISEFCPSDDVVAKGTSINKP